jgi:translation initiation factor 3 subunit L
MSSRAPQYQNGNAARPGVDDSDVEEEAMANDYREQVQYDGMDDMNSMPSINNNQDIHAQLQAAATPLEFQATLETKFASYDNYCNLFHYILNSEGPVDLEVPNVREEKNQGTMAG